MSFVWIAFACGIFLGATLGFALAAALANSPED